MAVNSKRSAKGRGLSILEHTVMGIAWLRGPCSIYTILRELETSASSYHKSRAGTVYSIANRLLDKGILEREPDGERVRLSASGVELLKEWVAPPTPFEDVTFSSDLLRLRFSFLGILEAKDRRKYVEDALQSLREFLATTEALLDENEKIDEPFGLLATVNIILETRARIQWLETVLEFVDDPSSIDRPWSATVFKRIGR